MSSSDRRIIKDAKLTKEPVVIERHDFKNFGITAVEADKKLEIKSLDEPVEGLVLDNPNEIILEKASDTKLHLSEQQIHAVIQRSADEIVQDAKEKAEILLQKASEEASSMHQQATEEIAAKKAAAAQEISLLKAQAAEEITRMKEQGAEEARMQGLSQGLENARLQMAEQVQETTEGCNSMIGAAEQDARQIILEAEPHIIDLVLAVSRKIIMDEVTERQEVVLNLVRSALERVRDQNQINIHVSAEDYELVLQARRELQGIVGAEQSLTITADAVLNKGGCLIETSFGTVEAGVETQLESIQRVLRGMLP